MFDNSWFEFGSLFIKGDRVDFFEFNDDSLVISCHWHINIGYKTEIESFDDRKEYGERCVEIRKLLGMIK